MTPFCEMNSLFKSSLSSRFPVGFIVSANDKKQKIVKCFCDLLAL